NSIYNLMRERQTVGNSTSRTESLTWTERGSYKDAVGASNGNGRPGTPTPVTSGRMRAVWIDLADATNKTVWVGGVDGGIWKTTGFWNVSKILCDASGNVYVGTVGSGNGLQRSTNGGTSWTDITPTINAGGGGNIITTRVADMVYDAASNKLHVVMGYSPGAG